MSAFSASAEVQLNDSQVWRRARLIAPGQQVWGLETSYQNYSDHFRADGQIEPLGHRYARSVTWGQLMAAENGPLARAEMKAYMAQKHVTESDIAATANYQVQRTETGLTVDWAYGLTRKWMIGFQMPLVYRVTRATSRVSLSPQLSQQARRGQQQSILALSAPDLRQKVGDLAQTQLANSGYDDIPDQKNTWDWGDISLMSRVGLLQTYKWTWSFQQMVRFPTAQNPSISDYLQSNTDDGQVDLGLTSLLDFRQGRWLFGSRLGAVTQLPDSVRMRVSPNSPTAIDPSVHRDLGDYVWAALDSEYHYSSRLNFDVEYSFLAKAQDRYRGAAFDSSTYAVLAQNTGQELHSTRLGLNYRLGELTSREDIQSQWVAAVAYTYPWIGRNSVDASRTSVELISYF